MLVNIFKSDNYWYNVFQMRFHIAKVTQTDESELSTRPWNRTGTYCGFYSRICTCYVLSVLYEHP